MPSITRGADAAAHLFAFRAQPQQAQAELDRLSATGQLQLSPRELADVCAMFQLSPPPGARAYGEGSGFSPAAESKRAGGAAGAQLEIARRDKGADVAWSDFALGRHKPGTGYAYFLGTPAELVDLVKQHWDERVLDPSRPEAEPVVTVKVPAERFMTTTVPVDAKTPLEAKLFRRRAHEEPYVKVGGRGAAQPAKFAEVVLYSKAALDKNGEASTKSDWEIVTLIASPVEKEPMDPVTMMRNMREKPGGTKATYSAEQLLDAIEFWSTHTKVTP